MRKETFNTQSKNCFLYLVPISFPCYNLYHCQTTFMSQTKRAFLWLNSLGQSTCDGLVPAINCLESWSFHLFGARSSWGLGFLMALSVTPWFCISSVDGFEVSVIDHHSSTAHHPEENEVADSISFCLAYALMNSYIFFPFFSVSFLCSLS